MKEIEIIGQLPPSLPPGFEVSNPTQEIEMLGQLLPSLPPPDFEVSSPSQKIEILGELPPSLPLGFEVSSPLQKIEILGQLPPSLPPGFEVSGPPQPQQQVQIPAHSVGISASSVSSTCPPAIGLSSIQAQMPHDSGLFYTDNNSSQAHLI